MAATKSTTPALFKPASLKPQIKPILPLLTSLPIQSNQCEKAINALLAHLLSTQEAREGDNLLGETEEKVFLVVGLKRAAKREVHKPIRLPLPHPVIDPRNSPVTLFVKDPQREYKDLLVASKISFINRVVGLEKLRTKHKTFEAKRAILKDGDMFLVDDRVVVEVGKAIGKMFRDAKKQPIPVSMARKDLKAELERALSSTYLQINTGSSLSIKFGTTALHTSAQLLANLLALLPQLVALPHSGWSNIQSLHIKTSTSVSLPIYSCSLEDESLFASKSTEELKAIEERRLEKLAKEEERSIKLKEKELRRIERSATRDGKGRGATAVVSGEKKRKVSGEEVVEEAKKSEEKEEVVVEKPEKVVKKKKTKA